MVGSRRDLVAIIGKARDQAKDILTLLESQGHPQTNQSNSLYLALVVILKRLQTVASEAPPLSQFVPELEQLAALCDGTLAPIKPLLEEAVGIARAR
ncbi:MAG: hypothetical protein ACREMV_11275 [Gemmatimonadales bacterium]